jgi:uncharacterized membrane protein
MVLEIIRIVFGFVFVLVLPGLGLTFALWPKTKKMVYKEILDIIHEKKKLDVAIVGRSEDIEEIREFLTEKSVEIKDDSDVLVLVGELDSQNKEVDIKGKTVIDLGNNVDSAINVDDTLDTIERIALSIGLSVAIVPLVGLVLNYSPFGIGFWSIFISMSLLIVLFFGVYYKRMMQYIIKG